jgi:hypothetical protein
VNSPSWEHTLAFFPSQLPFSHILFKKASPIHLIHPVLLYNIASGS